MVLDSCAKAIMIKQARFVFHKPLLPSAHRSSEQLLLWRRCCKANSDPAGHKAAALNLTVGSETSWCS